MMNWLVPYKGRFAHAVQRGEIAAICGIAVIERRRHKSEPHCKVCEKLLKLYDTNVYKMRYSGTNRHAATVV
jgi:hypothetical protein